MPCSCTRRRSFVIYLTTLTILHAVSGMGEKSRSDLSKALRSSSSDSPKILTSSDGINTKKLTTTMHSTTSSRIHNKENYHNSYSLLSEDEIDRLVEAAATDGQQYSMVNNLFWHTDDKKNASPYAKKYMKDKLNSWLQKYADTFGPNHFRTEGFLSPRLTPREMSDESCRSRVEEGIQEHIQIDLHDYRNGFVTVAMQSHLLGENSETAHVTRDHRHDPWVAVDMNVGFDEEPNALVIEFVTTFVEYTPGLDPREGCRIWADYVQLEMLRHDASEKEIQGCDLRFRSEAPPRLLLVRDTMINDATLIFLKVLNARDRKLRASEKTDTMKALENLFLLTPNGMNTRNLLARINKVYGKNYCIDLSTLQVVTTLGPHPNDDSPVVWYRSVTSEPEPPKDNYLKSFKVEAVHREEGCDDDTYLEAG